MKPIALALCAVALLSACGAEPVWAPDEAVARARYVHDGPPEVTLFTVLNKRSGSGAHSGLMINASERIMFDPAGTWKNGAIPERNDVHFGIRPKVVAFYIDYHARETYDVVEQSVVVTPEVAALVAAKVKAYGAVPKTQCAASISSILSDVPGFTSIGRTSFPKALMNDFGALPNVKSRRITDDDADKNHGVLMIQAGQAITDDAATN